MFFVGRRGEGGGGKGAGLLPLPIAHMAFSFDFVYGNFRGRQSKINEIGKIKYKQIIPNVNITFLL